MLFTANRIRFGNIFCFGNSRYEGICNERKSGANRRREVLEAGWVFPARVEDFQKTMKLVLNIKGRTIILTKVGDDFGAIEGICPHQGGPLYDGILEDGYSGLSIVNEIF